MKSVKPHLLFCFYLFSLSFSFSQSAIGEFKYNQDTTTLCDDDPFICSLINKFAPKFIFHPNEKFFPSTVDYFINNSSLNVRHSKKCEEEILPVGSVNVKNLGDQIDPIKRSKCKAVSKKWLPSFRKSHTRQEYFLDIPKEREDKVHKGFDPKTLDQNLILYANYGKLFKEDTFKGYEIQYWLFFPNNGSIGSHEGDWEGISVRTNEEGLFQYATYNAHSERRSYLKEQLIFADPSGKEQEKRTQIPEGEFTHPVVFVSKTMHASYSKEGKHRRWAFILKLPTDKTKRGYTFNSFNRVQLLPNRFMAKGNLNWVKFSGRWGGSKGMFGSPSGPTSKRGYNRGTPFRHPVKTKHIRAEARAMALAWSKVKFQPRYPISNDSNQWVMISYSKNKKDQHLAEIYRADDDFHKYRDLSLFNFNNTASSIVLSNELKKSYSWFTLPNYGGRKYNSQDRSEESVEKSRVELNNAMSSICWNECGQNSWVSFFEHRNYKGRNHFLDSKEAIEISNFEQTEISNDEVSSLRYCIPEGYILELFDLPNFEFESYKKVLNGSGELSEIDFLIKDKFMQNVIRSARIIPNP